MAETKTLMYVVEDDPTWVALLKGKFGKKFEIKSFPDGETAAEQYGTDKPKITILDYNLEGQMTGMDTLKAFKKTWKAGEVIMFSAQEDIQTAVDVLENGAYDYVVKKDGAEQRVAIQIRNIEKAEEMGTQVIELKLTMQRWKVAVYGLTGGILVLALGFLLWTCPNNRSIKWDPFGVANTARCNPPAESPYSTPAVPATPAPADTTGQ